MTEQSVELLIQKDGRGVLRLTMNRPEVHNAFDDRQAKRLIEALDAAAQDDSVRLVILGGEGKSFSAGGDINYMRRMGTNSYEDNLKDGGQLARLMRTINFFPKPTIARVQGAAFGGGVGLVSCCDIAIGGPKARFALSEVKLGMVPATISPYVVRSIGEQHAKRYFMSGEVIDAQRAAHIGLLSEVVDDLDGAVDALVDALLGNGPEATRLAKQVVFDVAQGDVDEAMIEHTVKIIADVRDSNEGREGLSAFLEKRKPSWQ